MTRVHVGNRRTRTVRSITIAAAGLLAAVAVQVVSATGAQAATGDAHLLVTSNSSANLFHTIRASNGSWQPFGDVEGQAGDLGTVPDAAGVIIAGSLHTLAVRSSDGDLYHAIRQANGAWTPFGNVEDVAGEVGTVTRVAAASIGTTLHVVLRTSTGGLMHTIRFADGTWQALRDVKTPAGNPGIVTDVSAAGFANGQLQVTVAVVGGGVFHTIRFADSNWQPFGNIKLVAGNPGPVNRLSASAIGGQLHLVVVTAGGGVFHTIRFASSDWQAFSDIKTVASDPGAIVDAGTAGFADGQLQVLVSTSTGGIFHAIRASDGSWQQFSDVKVPAGNPGPVGSVNIAAQ